MRVSTVCTEADIGIQHLALARELGMEAHSHLNMASVGTPEAFAEGGRIVSTRAARRSTSSTRRARCCRTTFARASMRCERCCPPDVAIGIHAHNNLSLAVANSLAAIEEGATIVDVTLAGIGAGAGNCQIEPLLAVLDRLGIETGVDMWRARIRPTTTCARS